MPAAADTATLGLPAGIRACLFDLDGVLTPTARIHAAAWREMFDAYLRERAARTGASFEPFEQVDYEKYVDGKPRYDGVRSFLASRGIELPEAVPAAAAAVFEDALAGVEAGRAGEFGFVVGVDRVGQADALREHGADIVVSDLAELLGWSRIVSSRSSRGRSARPVSTATCWRRRSRC